MLVGEAILSFSSSYALSRGAARTIVKGRAVAGAVSHLTIQATIQPASGRDLMILPEGERTTEAVVIFTRDLIRTANEAAGTPADVITYSGDRWQVHTVQRWTDIGGYYRAIAQRLPPEAP